MADTVETIRQRIEHYRRLLANGVRSEIARMYLEQISRDHAMLRELENKRVPEPEPPPPRQPK
jgi:hypothetical protein